MKDLMIYGGLGLLFGLAVQLCNFTRENAVRDAVALRKWASARTWLYLLGLGMVVMAFLCYLAVIDVDLLIILPLHSGVVLGGVLAGIAVGITGKTAATALCSLGGGRLVTSLCLVLGCAVGVLLARQLPLDGLQSLFPVQYGTLFRLTLDDPWLLGGSFRGLGCLGVLLCVAALFVRPKPTVKVLMEEEAAASLEVPEPDDELVALDDLEDEVEDPDMAAEPNVVAVPEPTVVTSDEPDDE